MGHDVVGVILELVGTILVHKTRQTEFRAKLDKRRLEAADIAVRFYYRPADAVCNCVMLANRAIEKGDTVVTLKIGRVRENQVRERHHFRRIRIGIDDMRDHVIAVFIFVR